MLDRSIKVTIVFLIGGAFFAFSEKPAKKAEDLKVETLKGKVVAVADLVKKYGSEIEADAQPWLALQTEDGKIYPILKDTGGKTFYRDARLLNRPMQVQGHVIPGSQLLQVLQVHSLKDGKPHEVYYWCEICAIKRYALADRCECCGGPMELKEVAVEK